MVAHFKVRAGKNPIYEITSDNVEALLGRRPPWFRAGRQRGDDRHFAVCPYCDTPIQFKGLYRRQVTSPRPYGSHTGEAIEGFPFNALDLAFCPYRLKARIGDKKTLREMGPVAKQLIDTAITEFDRIILILREDFGFPFSKKFALRMLEQWIDSKGYLYIGAHLRNLPWMVAYFGPDQTLFGQFVGKNAELKERLETKVPGVGIEASGQLLKGPTYYLVELQCLHHRAQVNPADGSLVESLQLRVKDFTHTNEPGKAPTIYQKEILFNPERFEALVHTPAERAHRDQQLLDMAKTLAASKGLL
ncbi:hypothetical protein [Azotobacter vinelandii]|uniref:hypothetical protein n=1 Tax=Azotobacter vinelandii TaxID=354 RepID=UPI000AD464CD|nr:hypothetical protein [Azotobacter vinelandii]WKN23143.1 hypothetical protein AVAEIV_001177 [Azotobacter vinelandii]